MHSGKKKGCVYKKEAKFVVEARVHPSCDVAIILSPQLLQPYLYSYSLPAAVGYDLLIGRKEAKQLSMAA